MSAIERAVSSLGGVTRCGRALGVSHEAVRRWMLGLNRITAERAVQIEQATAGAVTRYELRPDVFGTAPDQGQQQEAA